MKFSSQNRATCLCKSSENRIDCSNERVMNRLMRLECTFSAQRVCPKLAVKSPSLNIWTSLDSIADY